MPGAKLYVIPGSHPSRTAMLMLERKGIPYKRVDLMPMVSKGVLKAQRFPGITVPALKIDGDRVQGSMEIGRELDRIQPDPALYPADPAKRARVEEAEAWGDGFQQKPRRFSWWAFGKDRAPMASYSEGARLGVPVGLAVKTGGPLVALAARLNEATDANVRADLSLLRADLDRIDAWIAEGVIGGPEPNAADYQLAPSIRLLMSFDDLRPFIEGRPAGEMAMRVVPDFPGRTPPVAPAEWLEGLRSGRVRR
ncbi:MAG TPA: glutathione S-transferase N-terminal domain-containing protein [Solirubrobacterales bacterium]|nr:glutathione S-transferase N-terminal domain-containing protein [Solirubrobacterales bacterium]